MDGNAVDDVADPSVVSDDHVTPTKKMPKLHDVEEEEVVPKEEKQAVEELQAAEELQEVAQNTCQLCLQTPCFLSRASAAFFPN